MNIVLWILQILFALYYIAGGIFMIHNYRILATSWALNTLPQPLWILVGALQVLFAVGLILPGLKKGIPGKVTIISAIGLLVISLLGSVLFATYAGVGILWSIIPAILLAFIAYKRKGWR